MEKKTVIKSLIYKFSERFAVKGLGLLISIVLARLLAPEAFGQIVILTVVINLSLIVIEGGLSAALVQSREVDDRDYSTVFYITLALAAVMIVLLQLAAPLIARFYRSEALVAPLRAYSFALLFMAFNSIQVARLQREMRFREMMLCNLSATIGSGAIGIFMAMRGCGLWALVVYYSAQILVSCLAMLLVLRWFPRSPFSMDSARRLYSFGIKILGSTFITTLYADIRPLIIGRKFSTGQLAYYDRGQRFSSTISINIDQALQSVMFPVLSRSQDDPGQLLGMLRRTRMLGAFITFPVLFGIASVAEPLVRLLLTEVWLPSVLFVEILCVAEAQMPLTSANLVTIKAMGRSDVLMKLSVLRICLMLVVLLISVFAFDSVTAITVGYLISAWVDTAVTSVPIRRLLGYRVAAQFRDIGKTLLSSVLMAAAVYALGLTALPPVLLLPLQILLGAVLYLVLNLALRNESLLYMLRLIKNRGAEA